MNLQQELKKVKDSKEFIDFNKKEPSNYLSSIFIENNKVQFHFYNPGNDKITSFNFDNDKIIKDKSEVFRKEKNKIEILNLDNIKTTTEEIKEIISNSLIKHKQTPKKTFLILQKEDSLIWNTSTITNEFNLLHIKINAITGKIINDTMESVLNLKADVQ